MRLVSHPEILIQRAERAFDAASDDTLEQARATAPHKTGQYAASLELRRSGTSATLGSPLPQAGAIERGANVGPRKGPHMGPVGTLAEAGAGFVDHMTRRLRAG